MVTDSNKKPVDLDRSKLLGFDHNDGSALPTAKVGPKESASTGNTALGTKMGAKVGLKGTIRRSQLLGIDQAVGIPAALSAKVGTKTVPSVETATGFRSTLDEAPADRPSMSALTFPTLGAPSIDPDSDRAIGIPAALSAKVGTKTFITSVATAAGFRSTLNDAPANRPSAAALTFPIMSAPSIGLDWSHLLGFDQAVRATAFPATNAAMVGEKTGNPALSAKVGSKNQ